MNFLHYSRTFVVLALLQFGTGLHAETADDASSPKEFVAKWVDTFNQNNPDAILEFYDPSDALNVFVSAGLWYRGIDEVKQAYEKDGEAWTYHDSKLKKLRVRELDGFAVAAFEHRFKLKANEDKKLRLQIQIRTTMTLRKTDSGWKIVSEHSSAMDGIERVTVLSE